MERCRVCGNVGRGAHTDLDPSIVLSKPGDDTDTCPSTRHLPKIVVAINGEIVERIAARRHESGRPDTVSGW